MPMRREILIVEDEEDVRRVISAALTSAGYEVATVASGREMESYLTQHPSPTELVVLMDIALGMENGLELAQAAQARFGPLRVLFMSGFADDVLLMDKQLSPADAQFIRKPFVRSELLAAVATLAA